MKKLFSASLFAALLAGGSMQLAHAGYCGAASFRHCSSASTPCTSDPCHTVMKTVREVVYEQQEVQSTRQCTKRSMKIVRTT